MAWSSKMKAHERPKQKTPNIKKTKIINKWISAKRNKLGNGHTYRRRLRMRVEKRNSGSTLRQTKCNKCDYASWRRAYAVSSTNNRSIKLFHSLKKRSFSDAQLSTKQQARERKKKKCGPKHQKQQQGKNANSLSQRTNFGIFFLFFTFRIA